MDHADVRMMLSALEPTAEADTHLGGCRACRAWRESLERVRALSAEMATPPVPAALFDRVIAAVREAPAPALAPLPTRAVPAAPAGLAERAVATTRRWAQRGDARTGPPWWRRVGGRFAIAAALTAAVAVAAVTVPDGSNERAVLVASAAKTEAAHTARVEYTGTIRATVTLTRLPPLNSLPSIPNIVSSLPQLPSVTEGLPDEVREAFERSIADARRHISESFDRAQESARRAEERAREAYRRSIERLEGPTTVEMHLEGSGEVVFPDRLHLKGTVRTVAPVPFPERSTFELIQIGNDAWIKLQLAGGKWVRIPSVESPPGIMIQPGRALDAMRAVGVDVRGLGRDVIKGVPVERYRGSSLFTLPEGGDASGRDALTVDVLIGSNDEILRRADMSAHSEIRTPFLRSTHESSMRFALSDFGRSVQVNAPARGNVVDGSALFSFGVFLLGFGDGGLSFTVDFTPPSLPDLPDLPELPEFEVPEIRIPEFQVPVFPTAPVPSDS